MKTRLALALLSIAWPVACLAEPPLAAPEAIAGFWQTAGGGAIIHITASDGRFPGRIAWLKQDHYPPDDAQGMGGQPVVDRHNDDPAKRDRPLIGLQMIKNLDYHVTDNDRAEWANGRVYDSDRGRWFDCYIRLADPDHLKLHGYIGIRALGRTTTWTRVANPRDVPSADSSRSGHKDRS